MREAVTFDIMTFIYSYKLIMNIVNVANKKKSSVIISIWSSPAKRSS